MRCSRALDCAAVFRVFVPAAALKDTVAMSDNQERRARPLDEEKESSALVKYRAFMKAELARLRRDESGLERRAAFSQATAAWRVSPVNPMNSGASPSGASGRRGRQSNTHSAPRVWSG